MNAENNNQCSFQINTLKERSDRIIILPGEFIGLNEYTKANRTHWAVGANMKSEQDEMVYWSLMEQRTKKITTYPIVITFYWYCKNKKRDPDNIASAKKYILDAMQDAGILVNDGWKQIKGFGGDWFDVDKKYPRVEVYIEEWK